MSEAKKTKKPAAKKADDAAVKETKKTAKSAEPKAEKKTAAKAEKAEKKAAPTAKKKSEGVKKSGKLVDDIRLYDVIQRPIITEKSTFAAEQNKVVFRISPQAGKDDVKRAVEALFGVTVTKVNTIAVQGKTKRFRGRLGQRSDYRKAIVTLKEGQSIDLAAGLK